MSDSPYAEFDDDTDIIDMWLEKLGFSARTANALYNNDITTFDKLASLGDTELLDLRGLGQIGYNEIREKLDSLSSEDIESLIATSEKYDTYDLSTRYNIRVNEDMINLSVELANLTARTQNALLNNGVYLLGDLTAYNHSDLRSSFKGLGESGVREIEKFLISNGHSNSVELHEFILSSIESKQQNIFDRYYSLLNSYKKTSLESVAIEFNLTRERVRQINKAVLIKIAKAIKSKAIKPNIEITIYEYINSPVQELPELSEVYNKYSVLKVYVDSKVFDIALYKNNWLKSEWVVDNDFNIEYQVSKAVQALKSQIGPVKIEELANSYSVNEKILYDISKTTINDGLIVLNTNKRAAGNDLAFEIEKYMDKTVRPVTLLEVQDVLKISANQARGRIYRIPGVVNVGLSTFALEKYGYSNKTITEIAEELLSEEGQPIHIEKIVSYIKKYMTVKDSSIPAQLSVYTDIFTKLDDGYYSLKKWGYIPANPTKNTRLEVPAAEAVLDILSDSIKPISTSEILNNIIAKYGNKSTSKSVTVSSVLVKLQHEGIITKLGTDRSPFYIKTK